MKETYNILEPIRSLEFSDSFIEFYSQLDENIQMKFYRGFDAIKHTYVLNTNLIKKLVGTDFYEMRIPVGNNQFRTILFAVDNENLILAKKVLLLNGFIKKSTKDYNKQIKKAETILKSSELWNGKNI
jgi:L-ribulose-5-phosphate 3-epimerase UlaE